MVYLSSVAFHMDCCKFIGAKILHVLFGAHNLLLKQGLSLKYYRNKTKKGITTTVKSLFIKDYQAECWQNVFLPPHLPCLVNPVVFPLLCLLPVTRYLQSWQFTCWTGKTYLSVAKPRIKNCCLKPLIYKLKDIQWQFLLLLLLFQNSCSRSLLPIQVYIGKWVFQFSSVWN